MNELPGYLTSQISAGDAVLVLGAGSSLGATDRNGKSPPTTSELTARICDEFLGGNYKDLPLNQASEYALSESSLSAVQGLIAQIFERFNPSPAHLLVPTFRWRGIATTNYDRLIEKAYESCNAPAQSIRPFIENGDSVDDALRDPNSVMLLKLHGCITRTAVSNLNRNR